MYLLDWIIYAEILIISYRATCILTKQLSRKLAIIDPYLNNDNLVWYKRIYTFRSNGMGRKLTREIYERTNN